MIKEKQQGNLSSLYSAVILSEDDEENALKKELTPNL